MKMLFKLSLIVLLIPACTGQNDPIYQIPKDATPIALSAAQQKRVSQDNSFAFDLLKNTIASSDQTNVFVSPLSVSIALGMAWNGANGDTKTEMETALKMNGMTNSIGSSTVEIFTSGLFKISNIV